MTSLLLASAGLPLSTLVSSMEAGKSLPPGQALSQLVASGDLDLPYPGSGETRRRFAALELLGSFDLSLARLAEGHLDARAILEEASHDAPEGTLGVWAAGPIGSLR